VLALGNTASRAVFGFEEPMGAVHGRVVQVDAVPGLATYHPAAALRASSVVQVMRRDLAVLRQLLEAP
jgi:uracil-DNA glycosylase family 4